MNIYFLFNSQFRGAGQKLLFVLTFLSACTPAAQDTQEHPAYFNNVLERADSIAIFDVNASHAYLEQAYAAFRNPGKIDLYRKYAYLHKYHIGVSYKLSLAALYADSMLLMFEDQKLRQRYPLYYARSLFAKGDALRDQQKYSEAYTYFYSGREALRHTNDTCQYNEYASRLALVYYRQEKYLEAARYFTEAAERLSYCDTADFNIFYTRQGALDNIALSYHRGGQARQALAFYDSTLRYIQRHGAKFRHVPEYNRGIRAAVAVVQGNKGGILLQMGDTLGAEALFRQNIDTNKLGRYEKEDAQLTMTKLIALYLAAGRLADANTVLRELKAFVDTVPSAEVRQHWLNLQWQYYERTGRQGLGYGILKAYVKLRDSLAAAAIKPSIADINKEFDRMAREYQVEILQKNNELKTAYISVLVFLFITVILAAWMIWQNWRKSRSHVKELQRLNQEITAQHEHIRKSLTALEQSHQGHARMMKIVAHDLRNPVGAIYSLSELLLLRKTDEVGDKERELLDLIRSSSSSALNLISDLLVLDTSLEDMEKELIEIHVALKYCVDLLQMKAMEKRQHITLDAEPVQVLACREKIWRVFSNLINNAIKFSPDGSSIEVKLKRMDGNVRISVSDHGIGIPPQLQDKIFGQSTEAKRRGTRGEESFGFGLSISKQIIEAHDGRIWFETEAGKGTTFYVEMKASA